MLNRLTDKLARSAIAALLPIALTVAADSAAGQETVVPEAAPAAESGVAEAPTPTVIYEREVFEYSAAGRPDPFRSLLEDGQLGIRLEDLTLRGVVYHPDPSRSVAVLTQTGSSQRIQARVGERVGTLRILSIRPDRVEVVVEELGVSRRETLTIERPQNGATP